MEKVKLPRDVADALECALKLPGYRGDKAKVLSAHVDTDGGRWSFDCKALNKINLLTLAKALINGYEVEQTPEDKVREMFSEAVTQEVECVGRTSAWWEGRRMTIIDTLNALGIKISGVNASDL